MAYMIFDTETTGLDKPFCYDIGYIIFSDEHEELARRHFIVEQTWHNLPLFESAYYAQKRPQYVQLMRSRKATMDKYGYIMRNMKKDIREYNVTCAYAYNSDFDEKVFNFNCDWYKCNNPFDTIPIHDIWGYASQFITNCKAYKPFCEEHEYFTDKGNYSGNAETVFRYLTKDTSFEEAHVGLYDCEIEAQILQYCFNMGAKMDTDYPVTRILNRSRDYIVKINGEIIHVGKYTKKYIRGDVYNFTE